jgi:hypothetical protein
MQKNSTRFNEFFSLEIWMDNCRLSVSFCFPSVRPEDPSGSIFSLYKNKKTYNMIFSLISVIPGYIQVEGGMMIL